MHFRPFWCLNEHLNLLRRSLYLHRSPDNNTVLLGLSHFGLKKANLIFYSWSRRPLPPGPNQWPHTVADWQSQWGGGRGEVFYLKRTRFPLNRRSYQHNIVHVILFQRKTRLQFSIWLAAILVGDHLHPPPQPQKNALWEEAEVSD